MLGQQEIQGLGHEELWDLEEVGPNLQRMMIVVVIVVVRKEGLDRSQKSVQSRVGSSAPSS